MKKGTKIIVLVAMVVLLGVTGYLNISLNNRIIDAGTNITSDYFASFKKNREETREQTLLYYQSMIANATTDELKEEYNQMKLDLIAQMQAEFTIEELIKSKGFEDCVVTRSNNYFNVMVKSAELTQAQVAQIFNIVQQQTGLDIDYIKIHPVG